MQDYKEMGDNFEVRLGNREVAVLIGVMFLVALLAFALGVMMGKRLYGRANLPGGTPTTVSESPPSPAVPPQPETPAVVTPQPAATQEQYTFYDTLRDVPVRPSTQTVTAPPAPSTPPAPPAPTPPPVTSPAPPTAAPTSSPPSPPTTQPAEPVQPPPTPPAAGAGGEWGIQVSAVTNRQGAEDYVKKLRASGLDAWIATVPTPTATYYCVRIGHYPSQQEALAEMNKLKEAKKIPEDSFVRKK